MENLIQNNNCLLHKRLHLSTKTLGIVLCMLLFWSMTLLQAKAQCPNPAATTSPITSNSGIGAYTTVIGSNSVTYVNGNVTRGTSLFANSLTISANTTVVVTAGSHLTVTNLSVGGKLIIQAGATVSVVGLSAANGILGVISGGLIQMCENSGIENCGNTTFIPSPSIAYVGTAGGKAVVKATNKIGPLGPIVGTLVMPLSGLTTSSNVTVSTPATGFFFPTPGGSYGSATACTIGTNCSALPFTVSSSCGELANQTAVSCPVAGATVPALTATTKSNTCPTTTINLTSITAFNQPANTTLTWHTSTPATTANKVTGTAVTAGTYYAAFFDATSNCYSGTNGSATTSVTATSTACGTASDSDGDGVADSTDLDDDNDGILDTDECGCAAGGFVNGGFELPATNSFAFFNNVPGWKSTAPGGDIEFQNNNQLPGGATSGIQGNQYVELNAAVASTLYQTFCINGLGGTINWSIRHRGRFAANDIANVRIGTSLIAAQVSAPIQVMTDNNTAWKLYTGTYNVPVGVTSITIAFEAVSSNGGAGAVNQGNFIDDVKMTFIGACVDTDNDGIVNSLDLDSDSDGCTDADEFYQSASADGNDNGVYGVGNPTVDATGKVTTASYTGNSLNVTNASIKACTDTDNDGIVNIIDIDDDNDGVIDTDECGCAAGSFANSSFETPIVTSSNQFQFFQNIPGWKTTATDNNLELHKSGLDGNPSSDGNQFAELNASQASTLYQTFCINGLGGTINWSIRHRGRFGIDVANVRIGTSLANAQASSPITVMTDNNTAWGLYTGTYNVPLGVTSITIAFEAVSSNGGAGTTFQGNLIDDVKMTFVGACVDTDNDGIVNSLDLDSDNDGCSDAFEAGATTDKTTDFKFTSAVGTNGLANSLETTADNGVVNYTSTYPNATTAIVRNCIDPLIANNPAPKTGVVGGTTTGIAVAELLPTGGFGKLTYSNGTTDPACMPVSGATVLPAASLTVTNPNTGEYTITNPTTPGTYFYCIKICDSSTPTPTCIVKTYTLTITAAVSGIIDCSKTQIYPAPMVGSAGQKTLVVTINVTTAGCFTPITVSGSGMTIADGFTQVCATATGIQNFSIPVNYDGTALGTMNFTIGSATNAGSCSADLTKTPKKAISDVWTLDCVPTEGPILK